jgi:glycosyltransferase involved in cell wall biosynthesis
MQPIINTQENDEYRSLIELYKMGYNCKNNDAKDIADKIILLLNNDELKKYMGKNARKCAEELFNRKYTYKKILNLLQSYRIE